MPGTKAHGAERSTTVAKTPKSALEDWKEFGAVPCPRVLLALCCVLHQDPSVITLLPRACASLITTTRPASKQV
ncbi:hypothetical protein HBI56_131860 [Parastagonospora nodorum]|nr:hypothetical protein HBH53_218670 [Parastagonospora nodorum]KAH3996707.1 hypothetical protein HBI10_153780 [Parastagonospora nodorum]KAH4012607.1 hypothetical protein HBI13_188470 [Parastagonospora nodorum]KAH4029615.1 hypothetical protein HBI09_135590 [Parastagonospora nodorum]KAH4102602.1 hypothetical protein HBH46_124560 [Parastagonospora nodorum]